MPFPVHTRRQSQPLPPLRADIEILPGPRLPGGSPTWTIHDPVRNTFYRLGRREYEIIARWPRRLDDHIPPQSVAESVNRATTCRVTDDDIGALRRFLAAHCLLAPGTPDSASVILARRAAKKNWLLWLVHNYLFFRVPLIRPQKFLDATLPMARLLVSPPMRATFCLLAAWGLVMVSRQWQAFTHTLSYFFNTEGLLYYALALAGAKILHEFGHAYTARHYGVRVPRMGIAVIVLWPMLYSDTTESWKLNDRKQRMRIVAAGVAVELALAALATLLWSLAGDGPFKSACFIVASVSWVTSLLLNMSPFMRFDGYYLLADFLDIPNLHERSSNLCKWWLRRIILGAHLPCPETLPAGTRRFMTAFALATWLYRLMVFTGIAVLVYHTFFKALGMVLFSVEIGWFVILPVMRELSAWWGLRREAGYSALNITATVTILGVLAGAFFLPWHTTVEAGALLTPRIRQRVYPPVAARLKSILARNGARVRQGDVLFVLEDPLIDLRQRMAEKTLASLEVQLARQIGNNELLQSREMLKKQIVRTMTEIEGYREQRRLLTITAPADGMVTDVDGWLQPGQWLGERHLLCRIIGGTARIEAYVKEEDLARVAPDTAGKFYADNTDGPPLRGTIGEITPIPDAALPEPYLASIHGGPVAADFEGGELVPLEGIYKTSFSPAASLPPPDRVTRGTVFLDGKPMSLFSRLKRQVTAVLVRESGF